MKPKLYNAYNLSSFSPLVPLLSLKDPEKIAVKVQLKQASESAVELFDSRRKRAVHQLRKPLHRIVVDVQINARVFVGNAAHF